MPQEPQSDQDFLKASPTDQHAYLMATDPDYAKASKEEQQAYLQHIAPPAPNAGLAPPAKPPMGAEAAKTMTSGEGPIARGMTSFETQMSQLPGAVGRMVVAKRWPIVDAKNWHELGQDIKGLNPIVKTDPGTPNEQVDYGATAANLLPMLVDVRGGGITESPAGMVTRGMVRPSLATKTSVPIRMLQTGEQALSNFDVTRPLKSVSDIPKYWEQTSRGGRLLADTKQAIGEGRASRIPTRLSAEQQAPPPEPQAAALGRPVQSGTPDAALGRIPAMRDPYATVPALRAKLTAVPRESWEMGEMPATSLPQSEVLGRLGTPAGEKLAMRQFMSENPSALGRIASGAGEGAAKAPGAAGAMAEDVIKGNLPRGFGRLVLTPEETLQAEQMMRIAERSARRRGMQFAGGQVPAEGRSVPVRPRPNPTEEWRSKKE